MTLSVAIAYHALHTLDALRICCGSRKCLRIVKDISGGKRSNRSGRSPWSFSHHAMHELVTGALTKLPRSPSPTGSLQRFVFVAVPRT